MSSPSHEFSTKLAAGISFWAEVYKTLYPIMLESQELVIAHAPELLKRGSINPIEFFTLLLQRLNALGSEHKEPIYHQKATELYKKLDAATHRVARYPGCSIADRFDPSISADWDNRVSDDWKTTCKVAALLSADS